MGAVAALAAVLAGCSLGPAPVLTGSAAGYPAVSRPGGLTARLPGRIDVLTALAAAERVLERRGYTIVGRYGSQREGRMVGKYPSARLWEETSIFAFEAGGITEVRVWVTPLGDAAESQAVLEAMLGVLRVKPSEAPVVERAPPPAGVDA